MILRFIRSRSAHGLAVAAVSVFPMLAVGQTHHFPTPGTDPARPETPAATIPQTPAITPDGSVVEDVIARVNDQIISRSDLERAQAQLQQELSQSQAADGEERQKNLLRDLIDQQLLISKGKDLEINPDAEVVRRLDELRKQNHLATMDDLEKAARQQGVSFEDFKAQIRNNVITQSVVRDEVARRINMTQSDEQKYYNEHKEQFAQPEQVRLSEILVPVPTDASDEVLAISKKKADSIETSLEGGANFSDTAKKMSGGPTAEQGGDLGYFKRGTLAPVLENATFDLKAGQFTKPIRTRQGYVILQVADHQVAGTPPLSQVEDQVREAMYSEEMAPALRAYLTKLREEAYIDIKPGFVDTGASPHETKPVFSAYTPPAPKKKVEHVKARFDNGRHGANNGTVETATVELNKHGKPKKVNKEKIRYGQAPRVALPAGPVTTADAVAVAPAPGTAIAPTSEESNTLSAAANSDDPLAPAPAPKVKSRYSSREIEKKVNAEKVAKVERKAARKIAETPEGPTTQEQSTRKVQATPLGLNGDTATKKKKKRKKGDPKDRLQNKTPEKAAPLVQNPLPDKNTGLPPVPAKDAPASQQSTQPATTQTPAAAPTQQQ